MELLKDLTDTILDLDGATAGQFSDELGEARGVGIVDRVAVQAARVNGGLAKGPPGPHGDRQASARSRVRDGAAAQDD